MVQIWANSSGADVIVVSEAWLSKAINDKDVALIGFNIFRADRPKKGGGIAIYVKSHFVSQVLITQSLPKQFELLALNITLPGSQPLTVIGCYRPPSASSESFDSLTQIFSQLQFKEVLLIGDLNWDWLSSTSDDLKAYCLSVNLTQMINIPTRPNSKNQEKSTLLDLVITNMSHKYSASGIFANDLSDHCVVGVVRDTKLPKNKAVVIKKRNLRNFSEQAFLWDIHHFNWHRIALIDDVQSAWLYFFDSFTHFIDKHAPYKVTKVKGRVNAWFTPERLAMGKSKKIWFRC